MLDINTKRGQESLRDEHEMLRYIQDKFNVKFVESPKDKSSACDGFICQNYKIVGLFESKCRYDMDSSLLKKRNSWLITHQKLLECQTLSRLLKIPFVGFLYLVSDKTIYSCKITDENGDFIIKYDVKKTITRKTINGGEIIRENAFIPVKDLNEL